jgi:hypothetical protein
MKITSEGKEKHKYHQEFLTKMIDSRINICIAMIAGILVAMFTSNILAFLLPLVLFFVTLQLTLNYQSKLENVYRSLAVEQIVFDTAGNIPENAKLRQNIEIENNKSGNLYRLATMLLRIAILSFSVPIYYYFK